MSCSVLLGIGQRQRDDDALAGRKAVGLDHDRLAAIAVHQFAHVSQCRIQFAEYRVTPGRNVVPGEEVLGERLGAFELRGDPARPEAAAAGGAETIDDAGHERRFRPDDRQRDVFAPRELEQAIEVGRGDRRHCARPVRARVPALPGATSTSLTRGDCLSFHASACSRPPEPMTRIFMGSGTGQKGEGRR
jgi:hypothetical protein